MPVLEESRGGVRFPTTIATGSCKLNLIIPCPDKSGLQDSKIYFLPAHIYFSPSRACSALAASSPVISSSHAFIPSRAKGGGAGRCCLPIPPHSGRWKISSLTSPGFSRKVTSKACLNLRVDSMIASISSIMDSGQTRPVLPHLASMDNVWF